MQASEVLTLVLSAASVPVVARIGRRVEVVRRRLLAAAFLLIPLAHLFTVLEHLAWPQAFNLLEHAAYAVSGLLFLAYSLLLARGEAAGSAG